MEEGQGKETVQNLTDTFMALDKARERMTEDLVKAANRALGADLFVGAGYSRHITGVDIQLTARIPLENPLGFWDAG
jgi:hypothetical protein